MHMADALISPAVGGSFWVASAGLLIYSARKMAKDTDEHKAPIMGVLGAFVFAIQMINFSIPVTGSSGHLGGGLMLAILLGPQAGFITMASVLAVQSLLFADGGLLALGCNIFNMGFIPAFIAYPLVYRVIVGRHSGPRRLFYGSVLGGIVGLQVGALGVVLMTRLAGISDLPFGSFLMLMQPIHLAIGLVEGLATFAVVRFISKARPEVLSREATATPAWRFSLGLLGVALLVAGVGSWFASADPDGLEWAVQGASGREHFEAAEPGLLAGFQEETALLPDYGFKDPALQDSKAGTSLAGLVGGLVTLFLAGLICWMLRALSRRT